MRELHAADAVLARAEDVVLSQANALRLTKRTAARAAVARIDARDALYRAHRAALAGLVPGRHARRSAALRVAETHAADVHAAAAASARAHADSARAADVARADAAALADARSRQRDALTAAFTGSGALPEDQVLPSSAARARGAASTARFATNARQRVLDELTGARSSLTRALFLLVDARARAGIDLAPGDDGDLDELSELLPSARLQRAEAAVSAARRHMHAATVLAPDLPLAGERYVRAALLNAFVEVAGDRQGRSSVLVPKGFFSFAAGRVSDALAALGPSLTVQRERVQAAEDVLRRAEESAAELEEKLFKRRKEALFAAP